MIAECDVALAVALVHFDSIVDIVDIHGIINNVVDTSSTAASWLVAAQC